MKRTGFKRKLTKPLKRTKLKKKSKAKISTLQNKLWNLCKKITRLKYGNSCYTCPQKNLIGSNWQTGHVPWAKASLGAYLKNDLRLLRPQCYNCNINLGGMGAEAYKKMLKEIGNEGMRKLEKERQITVNAYSHYSSLIPQYEEILKELEKTSHKSVLGL